MLIYIYQQILCMYYDKMAEKSFNRLTEITDI